MRMYAALVAPRERESANAVAIAKLLGGTLVVAVRVIILTANDDFAAGDEGLDDLDRPFWRAQAKFCKDLLWLIWCGVHRLLAAERSQHQIEHVI